MDADFFSVRRLTLWPRPPATGTRRVSAPSRLAQRDVAKTWYPANLAEKFARLSFQGRGARLLAQSRKTADAFTWRTCPRLLGRADLEETEHRKTTYLFYANSRIFSTGSLGQGEYKQLVFNKFG